MPAYTVGTIKVTNPEKYQEYAKLAGPAAIKYGGRFLARGGTNTLLEGEFPFNRVVLIEFPSVEAARTFYSSPEYTEARSKRKDAAIFNLIITEGGSGTGV